MMLRGVAVDLPDAAHSRLQELQLQRDASLDAVNAAVGRLRPDQDIDPRMRERLATERGRHQQRFNTLI